MKRIICNVGHGGFYIEKQNDFTIVYDCGTLHEDIDLKKLITKEFNEKEDIDALFISHFDRDHINGVDFLLSYCNVKNVVIPFLDNKTIICTLINDLILGSSEINSFVVDPERFIDKRAKLIFVDNESLTDDNVKIDLSTDSNDTLFVNSGTQFYKTINKTDWYFIPYNFKYSKKQEKFLEKLDDSSIPYEAITDWRSWWETHNDNVKNIYKKIPGTINSNSLTLYSGPLSFSLKVKHISGVITNKSLLPEKLNAGCLYLGDYDATGKRKYEQLITNYQYVLKNVGLLQIPHHGSTHNFNNGLLKAVDDALFFISASETGKHPHRSVQMQLIMSRKAFTVVTESSDTRLVFKLI